MNTTHVGGVAENAVVLWLQSEGYSIIAKNWKNKLCEIDIIARRRNVVYIVEVRHRTSDAWGDGLASISRKKQQQVQFAAGVWMHNAHWTGDVRILYVATSGSPPHVNDVIEQ